MPFSEKGFTLIELLVVIAIIGILSSVVITSVNGQRAKARDVSFQSTANSVQGAVGICCSGGTGTINGFLISEARGDVCDPVSGGIYPASDNLGSVTVVRDCDNVDGFSVELTPGTANTGAIKSASCDHDRCDFVY